MAKIIDYLIGPELQLLQMSGINFSSDIDRRLSLFRFLAAEYFSNDGLGLADAGNTNRVVGDNDEKTFGHDGVLSDKRFYKLDIFPELSF